jgi:hypothetical protein
MGSIDSYIFRTTFASFAPVLVGPTGVIWIAQALRGVESPAERMDAIGTSSTRFSRRFGRPATA